MRATTLLPLALALGAGAAPIAIPEQAEKRQLFDLLGGGGVGGCPKIYHVHARGTAEPAIWNSLGMLVGSPFSTALTMKLGGVESEGVSYSASIIGAITGAIMPSYADGATKMAEMARKKMSQCPGVKVVLSGYSQGAEQVHGALQAMGRDSANIAAAVTFGDPMNMTLVSLASGFAGLWGSLPESRTKIICYMGDPVCGGIGISHLSYASSASEAADFVASVINQAPGAPAAGGAAGAAAPASAGGLSGLLSGGLGGLDLSNLAGSFNIFSTDTGEPVEAEEAGLQNVPTYGP